MWIKKDEILLKLLFGSLYPSVFTFLKKLLLLFNYSCMPFLPIPPPHPLFSLLNVTLVRQFTNMVCSFHFIIKYFKHREYRG